MASKTRLHNTFERVFTHWHSYSTRWRTLWTHLKTDSGRTRLHKHAKKQHDNNIASQKNKITITPTNRGMAHHWHPPPLQQAILPGGTEPLIRPHNPNACPRQATQRRRSRRWVRRLGHQSETQIGGSSSLDQTQAASAFRGCFVRSNKIKQHLTNITINPKSQQIISLGSLHTGTFFHWRAIMAHWPLM